MKRNLSLLSNPAEAVAATLSHLSATEKNALRTQVSAIALDFHQRSAEYGLREEERPRLFLAPVTADNGEQVVAAKKLLAQFTTEDKSTLDPAAFQALQDALGR